jgi:hypothetical protein
VPGPDHILDKGALATGSTAYTFGEVLVLAAGSQLAPFQVARATAAAGLQVIGVAQETLDVAKVLTGKANINVRILGISRVLAGGVIAAGATVGTHATQAARAAAVTRAIAGAQPAFAFGVALTASAANGDYIDVLLTPNATF